MKILETDRLILRVFEEHDIDPMSLIDQDPKVREFLPGSSDRKKTAAGVRNIIKHYDDHGFSLYAVELKSTCEMIGWCGLMIPSFEAHFTPAVEIGWRLASQHWNQGYATEAATAVLKYAFDTLKLKEVVSFTVVDNIRSRRVMEKIGLQRNPDDDFDHPKIEKSHSLCRHVLYRISHALWWGRETLLSDGCFLTGESIETVQNTPWSYVARYKTASGDVYLKQTPPSLAIESTITQILHDQFQAPVPKIMAINADLHCFLMKDAGEPLRQILKKQFDTALFCKAIDAYTALQLATADHFNIFLKVGVPDWRLDKFPELYENLLSETEILMADGLSISEIDALKKLLPMVSDLCRQLLAFRIKPAIVQCDFHDNNILINDQKKITLIDLGEIVISHPFFSLIGCLSQVKRHHGLTEEDVAYQKLMDACFKNYIATESEENLQKVFLLAQKLWCVYEACCQHRLRVLCDLKEFLTFQQYGKLADRLRQFLNGAQ